MHWLQSLDAALFHFGNGTLSNPFFDWLMPLLSGHGVPWLPVLVAVMAGMLFFGGARSRICALLVVLVIALGDPLVINTIKHAVGRVRPGLALPDAILRVGITTSGSMPSAHAANWFAATMVVFLFYRRSVWFMLPLAAGVAFSRVYCGVHYPGDVLAGAVLGAGYAIALVLVAQALWNVLGKRVFPAWYAHTPVLINPGSGTATPAATTSASGGLVKEIEWLRLGYVLIFITLIGHWIYLASGLIGLSEDEAYQWVWSKHLALSYYSKPPGIGYIQWAGTTLWGDTAFGVRFFSPVFAALMGLMMLRFMAREAGGRAAFFLILITLATPLLLVGSILMTIDPPLVLCWMWVVVAGWRAIQPDGKLRDWLAVGLGLGLGFLCKYTALFQIICWVIFLGLQPSARAHLKKAGPWLALLILGLCTLPVVIWNSQHGWITITHVAGTAGMHSKWEPTMKYFWEFVGSEMGLLNPVFLPAAIWATVAAWKWRRDRPLWLFLWCMSAPLFFGYWLFAFHSRVLPNWIAAAVPPMFCLMVLYWRERPGRLKGWLTTGLLIGILAGIFMHSSDLLGRLVGNQLPGDKDPTHRVRGWRETALKVEAERAQFDPNAFIIADHYGITGLFTIYSPKAQAAATTQTPLVYCIDSDEPANQFYFWDEYQYPKHRHGQNAIFVSRLDPYKLPPGWLGRWLHRQPVGEPITSPPYPLAERIAGEFESVTNLGVREIYLGDRVFQRIQLWGCYHLK